MPALLDPRHEAFAQARAKGALLIDAYESAGFVRHRGHPSRLALKREVADRIAALRFSQTESDDVSPQGLLASLRRIIKAGENSENPALVNAARLAIVDASRIQAELARQQAVDRENIDKDFKAFAAGEAAAAAPQPATERPSAPRGAPLSAPPAPIGLPAAAPSAPRGLPASAPRAPHNLLASAAATPLALPGLPRTATAGMFGGRHGPTLGRMRGSLPSSRFPAGPGEPPEA
jgi:hypothetical protein